MTPETLNGAVERLAARVSAAVGGEVELERPKDAAYGDFATNVALRRAKEAGRPPREIASELAEQIAALDDVTAVDVAGPGFLNLRLADSFFVAALAEVGEGYGGGWILPAEQVQVEMVSANPTGPILVSHARNGAYGDSVARLLDFAGDRVEREYYYNDSGSQMERFRLSVEASRNGEPIPEDGYHGAYVQDLARHDGDPVPAMLEAMEHDARALPHPLRLLAAPECRRAASGRALAASRYLRAGRRTLGTQFRAR